MRFSRLRFFIRSFPCFWEHAAMKKSIRITLHLAKVKLFQHFFACHCHGLIAGGTAALGRSPSLSSGDIPGYGISPRKRGNITVQRRPHFYGCRIVYDDCNFTVVVAYTATAFLQLPYHIRRPHFYGCRRFLTPRRPPPSQRYFRHFCRWRSQTL